MFSRIFKFTFFILIALAIFWFVDNKDQNSEHVDASSSENVEVQEVIVEEPKDREEYLEIGDDDTYGAIMEDAVGVSLSHAIYYAASSTYDLAKIRIGRKIELTYEKDTDILKQFVYKMDSEQLTLLQNSEYYESATSSAWNAFVRSIAYETRLVTKGGEVKSSMYQAALDGGIDERAIIELANAFQWTIDFAMDPRVGDEFKFVYEERYLNGEYVMPGRVMAGYYVNDGVKHEIYYFEENEENQGYFDQDANSVQKMFLKAPVEFRYISSGYTAGNRVVMEIGLTGPHRAIDYAAPIGTPIRTVGNGTVIFAGWKRGYGYMTSVRHNGTYTTNYAHQSKIAVKYGQKVSQGETIGYVGSTGYSTGPHLHYEMVKNGAKINPLKEVLPPGKPIKDENKDRFEEEKQKWLDMINN